MHKFSITDKLVIASLTISILTIIIVATFSFYRTKNAILERTFNQLTSVRVIKTNLLKEFINNSVLEVKIAKSSTDIKSILNYLNKQKESSVYTEMDSKIPEKNSSFVSQISENYFVNIFLIGMNKRLYYIKNESGYQLNNNDYYENVWHKTKDSKSVIISDLRFQPADSNIFLTLSAPITNRLGKPEGIIVFEISTNPIDEIMLEKNSSAGLGQSGESYLVGNDYLMRSSSRFIKNSILRTQVKTEAVDSAISNITGADIIFDYRGIKVLSSYGKISLSNITWYILAEIDYDEAIIPVYKIKNEIILVSVFIFIVVLIVVILFSKMITVPIEKLSQAAREIGSGNLNIKVDTGLNDEIGELAESFNKMTDKLKSQAVKIKEEQKKSLGSLIDGQEIERQRLSRELHDSLGQLLIGLKLKYENCLSKSSIKDIQNSGYESLGRLFDKTIDETRRISNNLMPAALSEFGLITAVRNICNEITESSGTNVLFAIENGFKINDPKINIYIFRIVQEALTNIVKHSKAKNASVGFKYESERLRIEIIDDGIGFEVSRSMNRKGHGLTNIYDRVTLLGGKMKLSSKPAKGTSIYIEIPLIINENE